MKHTIKRNRGFSLIEALIGFFIISIGMLGVASLQALSLKAGQTSVYTSVAMMKVEELFESMRSNSTVLTAYETTGSFNNCTGSTICTPTQLAQDDVFLWKDNLKAGLPSTVTGLVTVNAPTAPSSLATVTIVVSWQERSRTSTTGVSKTYTTATDICTAVPC